MPTINSRIVRFHAQADHSAAKKSPDITGVIAADDLASRPVVDASPSTKKDVGTSAAARRFFVAIKGSALRALGKKTTSAGLQPSCAKEGATLPAGRGEARHFCIRNVSQSDTLTPLDILAPTEAVPHDVAPQCAVAPTLAIRPFSSSFGPGIGPKLQDALPLPSSSESVDDPARDSDYETAPEVYEKDSSSQAKVAPHRRQSPPQQQKATITERTRSGTRGLAGPDAMARDLVSVHLFAPMRPKAAMPQETHVVAYDDATRLAPAKRNSAGSERPFVEISSPERFFEVDASADAHGDFGLVVTKDLDTWVYDDIFSCKKVSHVSIRFPLGKSLASFAHELRFGQNVGQIALEGTFLRADVARIQLPSRAWYVELFHNDIGRYIADLRLPKTCEVLGLAHNALSQSALQLVLHEGIIFIDLRNNDIGGQIALAMPWPKSCRGVCLAGNLIDQGSQAMLRQRFEHIEFLFDGGETYLTHILHQHYPNELAWPKQMA